MRVIASDRHRGHAPLAEIESSGLQPPFEHPGRADAIRDTLAADDRFATRRARPAWDAVGDRSGSRSRAGAIPRTCVGRLPGPPPRYPRRRTRRVRHARPHRRHRRIPGTGRRRSRARSLVLRDHHADHRGDLRRRSLGDRHRAVGNDGRARRPSAGLRAVPATGASRADESLRRLLLLQQRRSRRASCRLDNRCEGVDSRRRLPPRQRHPADLLPARRRPVRVAARRSRLGPTRTSPASPTSRAPDRGHGREPQSPAGSRNRRRRLPPALARRAATRSRRSVPALRHRVARCRHVPQRPDLRPRDHHRGIPRDRASWSPSSPCRRSSSRKVATTSTRSATTSAQFLLGVTPGV